MPKDNVRIHRDGAVLVVTLDRPEKLNAIDFEMRDRLSDALSELNLSDELRVMLLRGRGRYFTAGLDYHGFQPEVGGSLMSARSHQKELHNLYDSFERCEKPTIVAFQGNSLGAGIELALSCDFRIATASALLGLPEVTMLGVFPASGGVSRLTRLVGVGWTKWMAMAGQHVDAQTALTMGLVQAVYPDDEFEERATSFSQSLAALPIETLALAKLVIDASASVDRSSGRDIERIASTPITTSVDFANRVDAFLEGTRKKESPS